MMIHISLGGVGAIHAEGAWAYGRSPAWKITRFGREFVLDVPFGRVIITPARYVPEPEAEPCFCNRAGRMEWDSHERQRSAGTDRVAATATED